MLQLQRPQAPAGTNAVFFSGNQLPYDGDWHHVIWGWDTVLPHRGMFPRRQALPHQACSRCLIDPPAEPQLLF
jgi:hypothetical protein